MVLGDAGRARKLAGNPSTTNVSDNDVTQALTYGTSQVIRLTGKSDWEADTAHPDYATAQTAAEYYASSYIRDRFDDQRDISSEHYKRGDALAMQIAASIGNAGDGAFTAIAKPLYRSNPLNPNAKTYKSMTNTGQDLPGADTYYSYFYSYYNTE